jgi:hypothetical protein
VQLPIKNPFSFNEFLNLKDETIVDEDGDIFTSIVNHYAVIRLGKEEESSDEEVKEVDIAEALRAVETVKMWNYRRGISKHLIVLQ